MQPREFCEYFVDAWGKEAGQFCWFENILF